MNHVTLEDFKVETQTVVQAKDLDYLHVGKSSIQGLGLFTSIYLPANKILFRIAGRKVYREYAPAYAVENPNWLGTAGNEWLEFEDGDIGIYVNHSCRPNVIIDEHLQFVSIRPIQKNEELLLDYSTTEVDPYWSMKCRCGEACCRKTLLSLQYLPLHLQKSYSGYLSPALLKAASIRL